MYIPHILIIVLCKHIINEIPLQFESFKPCSKVSFIHTHVSYSTASAWLWKWEWDDGMRSWGQEKRKTRKDQDSDTCDFSHFKEIFVHFCFSSFLNSVITKKTRESNRAILPMSSNSHPHDNRCRDFRVTPVTCNLGGVNLRLWPQSQVTARSEDAEASNIRILLFCIISLLFMFLEGKLQPFFLTNTQLSNAHFEKQPWLLRLLRIKFGGSFL